MRPFDHRLTAVCGLLDQLVEATRLWSAGEELDDVVETIRHQALVLNHARYVDLIPAYRRLAEQQGRREATLASIVDDMLTPDDLFKSYPPAALAGGDFAAMTRWLSSLFVREIAVDVDGVAGVDDWRERLKAAEVYLAYSSGTSGQLSFVPRDALTLRAMRDNGAAYLNRIWEGGGDGGVREFDCLVLGPRGRGLGLQAAGIGLARLAARAHFLFDAELTADAVTAGRGVVAGDEREAAFRGAAAFVGEAARAGRVLVVFGPPFLVHELCVRLAGDRVAAAAGSLLVSGGGWKSFDGRRIPQPALHAAIEAALGIPRTHVIDTYGAAELNCVFMSCAAGRYHIPPLVEPVVLDEAYMGAIGEQGAGHLGFLDPFALSYPGFRITGDHGRLVRGRCPCGLSGWAIAGEIERARGQQVKGCGGVVASALA